jgi:hypothetical protein
MTNNFKVQGDASKKSDWRKGIREGEKGIARYNAERQAKSQAILTALKADEDKLEFITPKSATLSDPETGLELSELDFSAEFAEVL